MTSAPPDPDTLVDTVLRALPAAHRGATAALLFAQVAALPPSLAEAIVRRVADRSPADSWTVAISSETLPAWPDGARDALLAAVRTLPRGRVRVEALCRLAAIITIDEQREALEGILDGTSPSIDWEGGKPFHNGWLHHLLLRAVPEAWREEWVAHHARTSETRPETYAEVSARREIDHWPEAALRRLWDALHEKPVQSGKVPAEYYDLAHRLPDDLRALALERIRSCPDAAMRRHHLVCFDGDLTDDERLDLVEHLRFNASGSVIAHHIASVQAHLPRVPYATRRAWLDTVLRMDDAFWQQEALGHLAHFLDGADRDEALALMVRRALDDDLWGGLERVVAWLSPEALATLMLAASRRPSWWACERLVDEVTRERDETTQTRCFTPLLAELPALDAEACAAITTALSPWLARRTGGDFPRRLAARWMESR